LLQQNSIFARLRKIMSKTKKEKKDKTPVRYRIAVLNNRTLNEVWHAVASKRTIIVLATIVGLVLITIGCVITMFTPLRQQIPGYPSRSDREMLINNILRIDSIENILLQKDLYIKNLSDILSGKPTNSHIVGKDSISRTDDNMHSMMMDTSMYTNTNNQFSIKHIDTYQQNSESTVEMYFYSPIRGSITNGFAPETGHFGVDVVANTNDPILSVLDGIVVFAGWTIEAGYVIMLQHRNNIISGYKHNSFLFKQIGDRVRAGEPIGVIGNTGEYTTGPHLHFEMWQNGIPMNPTDYIIF